MNTQKIGAHQEQLTISARAYGHKRKCATEELAKTHLIKHYERPGAFAVIQRALRRGGASGHGTKTKSKQALDQGSATRDQSRLFFQNFFEQNKTDKFSRNLENNKFIQMFLKIADCK